ncbi:MAG: hypothetical protein D6706_07300 [Chloroflexi bacterium]|nr:MAG: hypothetical protein D6706_07300 [Chloroflexota bacterium]
MRRLLLAAYAEGGMWGIGAPERPLPDGLARGSETHLAFLTLVFAISGGRNPVQLWAAARDTFQADPELFNPTFLAYATPKMLISRLTAYSLIRKPHSESVVWQRIGQALVMRAGGLVRQLVEAQGREGNRLLAYLQQNKTTFPVLSGRQTAPRWIYGLAFAGDVEITGADGLPVPVSPAVRQAMRNLDVAGDRVTTAVFGPLDLLGRYGCRKRAQSATLCPVADSCPVARFCRYGYQAETL